MISEYSIYELLSLYDKNRDFLTHLIGKHQAIVRLEQFHKRAGTDHKSPNPLSFIRFFELQKIANFPFDKHDHSLEKTLFQRLNRNITKSLPDYASCLPLEELLKIPENPCIAYEIARRHLTAGCDADAQIFFHRALNADGLTFIKNMADEGNTHARFILGHLNFYGWQDISPDLKTAKFYLSELASQQHGEAQLLTGFIHQKNHQEKEAFNWFLKAAKQKIPEAEFQTGLCFNAGIGVFRNQEKAYLYISRAASQRHPAALFVKACMLERGDGVSKNPASALHNYRLAADVHFSNAQFRLAKWLQLGEFKTPINLADALYWYKKAAEQKHPQAIKNLKVLEQHMQLKYCLSYLNLESLKKQPSSPELYYEMGLRYFYGVDLPADTVESQRYFDLALQKDGLLKITSNAETGDVHARFILFHFYFSQNKIEKARYWLDLAAEQYHRDAQFFQGLFAEKDEDFERAHQWFLMAAAQDHTESQLALGDHFYKGIGTQKNLRAALEYYQLAAKKSEPKAACMVGFMYVNGEGVDKNTVKGLQWMEHAARKKDSISALMLGKWYEEGIKGISQDTELALYWYQQAINLNNPDAENLLKSLQNRKNIAQCLAFQPLKILLTMPEEPLTCYEIARRYDRGTQTDANPEMANKYYAKAFENHGWNHLKDLANADNIHAQYVFGRIQWLGQNTPKNERLARIYLMAAAEREHPDALYMLGRLAFDENNFKAGFKYLSQACKQGLAEALYQVGLCYYHGKGADQNLKKAFESFKKSAEKHDRNGQFMYGLMLKTGTATEKNLLLAFNWMKKSAIAKQTRAQYEMGQWYEFGWPGVEGISFQEAYKWYEAAAADGHQAAANALNRIMQSGVLDVVEPERFSLRQP